MLASDFWSWACPKVWLTHPMRLYWKKLTFPFPAQTATGDSFLVRHWTPCLPKVSVLGPLLTQTCAGPVAVTVAVSSYVHWSCCAWKTLFAWSQPSPLAVIIFPPAPLYASIAPVYLTARSLLLVTGL